MAHCVLGHTYHMTWSHFSHSHDVLGCSLRPDLRGWVLSVVRERHVLLRQLDVLNQGFVCVYGVDMNEACSCNMLYCLLYRGRTGSAGGSTWT